MYTDENYFWGLVAYGLGFLLMLPLGWKITGFLLPWGLPQMVVRLFLFAFFLTPVRAYPEIDYLAPAWVVAAFEVFQPTTDLGPLRAAVPIIVVFFVLLLGYFGWRALLRYRRRV